ncbi:MAG TPA: Gfo/Idh/MocA family oxidoreductase [Pirellulaceae bacterium]|nr:Gfo/Idh/MocA family oxidoreductase [Pirellulaceae bacterium]
MATRRSPGDSNRGSRTKVRYAVVGLGYIAQSAVLPAFAHTKRCMLSALISEDAVKLDHLSRQYGVEHQFSDYDSALLSGTFDAIYIALPNHLHCEYTVRAAEAGIHILCEKPMAITVSECEKMLHAAETAGVKLMIAYRLHFEEANLRAVKIAAEGTLGEVRAMQSVFAIDVVPGNIRLEKELGGGSLYDVGIYCINAARYLFRGEPIEVVAFTGNNGDPRFEETDEMTGAMLRFPEDRLAILLSSFGAQELSEFRIIGTKGNLRVEPAFDYAGNLTHHLTLDGKTTRKRFAKRDQFAPQLTYFARCIQNGEEPEPNGHEGLLDVRIIEALYASAASGSAVKLEPRNKPNRPSLGQEEQAPPVREKPELIHAAPPQPE